MSGRICLVTGANRGIGRETALGLARRGARLILVCRDGALGERVLEEARRAGSPGAELLLADFASLDSVRQLAAEVKRRHDTLHVLVNNAGLFCAERRVSADGHELTFAVNHLAPFLLTLSLLDLLKAGAPARVVNVSSVAHEKGRLDLDDLHATRAYDGMQVYRDSKLANVLFTRELARRLEGTGVTANSLHPGVIRTGLLDGIVDSRGAVTRLLGPVVSWFFGTPRSGARTSIHLAASPEVEGVNGLYFARCRPVPSSPASRDDALAAGLWEASLSLTGL